MEIHIFFSLPVKQVHLDEFWCSHKINLCVWISCQSQIPNYLHAIMVLNNSVHQGKPVLVNKKIP